MRYFLCFLLFILSNNICASDIQGASNNMVLLPKEVPLCSIIEGSKLRSGKFKVIKTHLSRNLKELGTYNYGYWNALVRDNRGFSVKEHANETIVDPPLPKNCQTSILILSDPVSGTTTSYFTGLSEQGFQYLINENLTLHITLQIKENDASKNRWGSALQKFFGKIWCSPVNSWQ